MLKNKQLYQGLRAATMTLPDERYRAVKSAQQFLARLAGGEYPRVPKAVRGEAYRILRHYPLDWDLKQAADAAPHVFQEQMEPLHRMVLQHEQGQQEQN
jgi:DNA-binding protein Fis